MTSYDLRSMIVRMERKIKKYPKHTCQFCGSDRKLVETIIDDEFYWDETTKRTNLTDLPIILSIPVMCNVQFMNKNGPACNF